MLVCLSASEIFARESHKTVWMYDTDDCTLERTPIPMLYQYLCLHGQDGIVGVKSFNESGLTIDFLVGMNVTYDMRNSSGHLIRPCWHRWYFYSSDGYFYDIERLYDRSRHRFWYDVNGTHLEDKFVLSDDSAVRQVGVTATFMEIILTEDGLCLFMFPTGNKGRVYVPVALDHSFGVQCTYAQFRKRVVYD